MTHGFKLSKNQKTHYSFNKTFGSTTVFPTEYFIDAKLTMPDQNVAGLPNGCTAEGLTDLATDQDLTIYSAEWQFKKSWELAGDPNNEGPMTAEQATAVLWKKGLLPKNFEGVENEETVAALYRRPVFFIEKNGDWVNSVKSAMTIMPEKRGVGVGTKWYAEFEAVGNDGILNENPQIVTGGHFYDIKGWTQKNSKGEWIRNGEVFFIAKTWQGPDYGDKGYVYISYELFDKLMNDWGTKALTIKDTTPGEIQTIEISLLTRIRDLWNQILNLLRR